MKKAVVIELDWWVEWGFEALTGILTGLRRGLDARALYPFEKGVVVDAEGVVCR